MAKKKEKDVVTALLALKASDGWEVLCDWLEDEATKVELAIRNDLAEHNQKSHEDLRVWAQRSIIYRYVKSVPDKILESEQTTPVDNA